MVYQLSRWWPPAILDAIAENQEKPEAHHEKRPARLAVTQLPKPNRPCDDAVQELKAADGDPVGKSSAQPIRT